MKPKIYSFLVNDNSGHKKEEDVNRKNRSRSEYKDVLLNKKRFRHSMNRIQSKDHKIGTYKMYIQNNGCDGLALGYQI